MKSRRALSVRMIASTPEVKPMGDDSCNTAAEYVDVVRQLNGEDNSVKGERWSGESPM